MVEISKNEIRLDLRRQIDDSYSILFGENLFPELIDHLKGKYKTHKIAIITDSNVKKGYGDLLCRLLNGGGLKANIFSIPAGEENKTNSQCNRIYEEMGLLKYGRDSLVIALGGGMIGDMAGFIASAYCRGIPFIQYPTTVLAQADAAVGGKTGVNLLAGKNLVGAFYQPKKVFVDVSVLETLSDVEFRNGLAETIKHGVISDAHFFNFLDENMEDILKKKKQTLLMMALANCKIKGEVVEKDPEERGLRRILNYGHTIGHAVEKLSNYEIPHGQCVSIGMTKAGMISNELGLMSTRDLHKQTELIRKANLPTEIPQDINPEDILNLTTMDKKAEKGEARFCLASGIGKMHTFDWTYVRPVNNEIVLKVLKSKVPY